MSTTQKDDYTDVPLSGNSSRTIIGDGDLLSAGWCRLEHAGYVAQHVISEPLASTRYRDALQQIASADLRRCSAGWLQGIARKALEGK